MDEINYLDLFSGIGGFRLGLEQAGFKFKWEGHSEIDKYAEQIYHRHFPESECLGDVKTIDTDRLPKINLITFGFPCQDISIAGKRGGLGASRSGLFFEAMRIIEVVKPDIFIFENVKGLFSSSEGRDFEVILRTIADIGLYDCEWQLLNTRWFLPQNRERIYFIGHLRGRSEPKVFPIGESNFRDIESQRDPQGEGTRIRSNNSCTVSLRIGGGDTKDLVAVDTRTGSTARGQHFISNTLAQRDYKGGNNLIFLGGVMSDKNKKWLEDNKENSRNFPQGQRVYSPEGNACQLTAQGGGIGAKTGLYCITQRSRGFNKGGKYKICPSLSSHSFEHNNTLSGIRRLTPVECERLQGFPDGWTEGISDTQRYKVLGNSVTINVVKDIGRRLLNE